MGRINKESRNAYDRDYYHRTKHGWVVYKLEDGTVGITQHMRKRLDRYRYEKKYKGKMKKLWEFKQPFPAIIVEAIYHWLGYKGCAYERN